MLSARTFDQHLGGRANSDAVLDRCVVVTTSNRHFRIATQSETGMLVTYRKQSTGLPQRFQ
jgi:hypothetical protein